MKCTNSKKDYVFVTTTGAYIDTMPLTKQEQKTFAPKVGKSMGFKNCETGIFDDYMVLGMNEFCKLDTKEEVCNVLVEQVKNPEKSEFEAWLNEQGFYYTSKAV